MSKPQWYPTDHYLTTECDECHNQVECLALENEVGYETLDVCEACFNKLDEHGYIAHED